jgi:hypothetical protein
LRWGDQEACRQGFDVIAAIATLMFGRNGGTHMAT